MQAQRTRERHATVYALMNRRVRHKEIVAERGLTFNDRTVHRFVHRLRGKARLTRREANRAMRSQAASKSALRSRSSLTRTQSASGRLSG